MKPYWSSSEIRFQQLLKICWMLKKFQQIFNKVSTSSTKFQQKVSTMKQIPLLEPPIRTPELNNVSQFHTDLCDDEVCIIPRPISASPAVYGKITWNTNSTTKDIVCVCVCVCVCLCVCVCVCVCVCAACTDVKKSHKKRNGTHNCLKTFPVFEPRSREHLLKKNLCWKSFNKVSTKFQQIQQSFNKVSTVVERVNYSETGPSFEVVLI